jgi:hypothetical protein
LLAAEIAIDPQRAGGVDQGADIGERLVDANPEHNGDRRGRGSAGAERPPSNPFRVSPHGVPLVVVFPVTRLSGAVAAVTIGRPP